MGGGSQFNGVATRACQRRYVGNVNHDFLSREPSPDGAYRWDQIGITTDQDELIALVLISIVHHGYCDIHIRPFFFPGVEESASGVSAGKVRTLETLILEFPENNFYSTEGGKRPQVSFLVYSLRTRDEGRKVLDRLNIVCWPEQPEVSI